MSHAFFFIFYSFKAFDKRNFYGTISHGGKNINEELLRNGLGVFVDWPKAGLKDKYKAAEK